MTRNSLMIGAGFAVLASASLVLASANAEPVAVTHDAAIKACSTVNPSQPVTVVNAVDDGSGIGFSLVWLNDKDGNLWMCDADADGNVYSYSIVAKDLLEGGGPELIGLQLASDGTYDGKPEEIAGKVCAAYLTDGGKVLATNSDGLAIDPGFVIFVEDSKSDLYLCNATSDAMVWAFEPIGDPLTFPEQVS